MDTRPEELSLRSARLKTGQILSNVSEIITTFYSNYSVKIENKSPSERFAVDGVCVSVTGVSTVC